MRYNNILEAVGRTPLIRLNRLCDGLKPSIYVKADQLNPGGSVKDRIAISMVDDAEKRGVLRPGGTIIEGTSGNTGFGLALVAAVRGYKMIFTIQEKQSREKINLLKALGAEVIVCPTAVAPDDPRSYYSIAQKLAKEIPNSYYMNQYDNPSNPETHYHSTGPEIWEDTEGKITHFVVGLGTGGTVSGTAKYLKEKNPDVNIVGVDPVGSLYHEFFHKGRIGTAHSYAVEGIGEDIFPKCMDFSLLDNCLQVEDKECFLMARKLLRVEGIFTGGSGGGAVSAGLRLAKDLSENDTLVIFLPDSGNRYLSKIYNDDWIRENQYFDPEVELTAEQILDRKKQETLLTVSPGETIYDALHQMKKSDISQIPVIEEGLPVGALYDDDVIDLVLHGKDLKETVVREVMREPFLMVPRGVSADQIAAKISPENPAVLVELGNGDFNIITKYDLVQSIAGIAEV
ncbi:MAG: pyridoxal-phosphate dependent enzyme [Planctomycetota bacterium]|jgi:cystathionine beta-synthase|nr:pyridoxal-phosphate dependent enzyme [Planctomycetota bacterium]